MCAAVGVMPGVCAARRGRHRRVALGLSAVLLLTAGLSRPRQAAAEEASFDIFAGSTEGAPVRFGVGIPLELFFKVAGSEAQVSQGPLGRGAGMLVDTRIGPLLALVLFGTVPEPPVNFPAPTAAEAVWAEGLPSPQAADASLVPAQEGRTAERSDGSSPVSVGAGRATATASAGPRGEGHAAYGDFDLSPPGQPGLLHIRHMASDSVAEVTSAAVTTASVAAMDGVELLGGMITIEGLRATASAVSTGRVGEGKAQSIFKIGRVEAMGMEAEITPDGIRITDTAVPLPDREAANETLRQALAQAGMTVRLLPQRHEVRSDGTFADARSQGLFVRVAASAARPIHPLVGDLSFNVTLGHAVADASVNLPAAPGGEGAPNRPAAVVSAARTIPSAVRAAPATPDVVEPAHPNIGASGIPALGSATTHARGCKVRWEARSPGRDCWRGRGSALRAGP